MKGRWRERDTDRDRYRKAFPTHWFTLPNASNSQEQEWHLSLLVRGKGPRTRTVICYLLGYMLAGSWNLGLDLRIESDHTDMGCRHLKG